MAGRRGNKEGTIRERPDGSWEGRVLLGVRDGKALRPSFYGKTKGEVQKKIRNAATQAGLGILTMPERTTLGEFLDRWLEQVVKMTCRPKTYRGYEQWVRLHIKPNLGKVPIQKLTPQRVQAFFADRLESGLSPRSVRQIRAVLRRALEQAVRWEIVHRNVVKLTDPPSVKKFEVQPWTPEQAQAFLKHVKEHRLGALYLVSISMGLRQGEVLGLRWDDVDLEKGELRVRGALQYLKAKGDDKATFSLVEPKSTTSRRTLTMPDQVVRQLRKHRARQGKERLKAGAAWEDQWGLVFTTRRGRPLEGARITRDFKILAEAAGLPVKRFHDLRHGCASYLGAMGVAPRVLMEILGHSQISLTMDTYSHVFPSAQKDAAERMNALLSVK